MKTILILCVLAFAGCSDHVKTVNQAESDSTAKILNNSETINDSTRLPKDSHSTGVQH